MFRSFIKITLAAALSFFIVGAASAQMSDPGRVYSKVEPGVMLSVLAESGFQTSIALIEGISVITATKAGRTPLILSVVPCPGPGMPNCYVLVMMSFAPDSILPGATAEARLAALAAINAYDDFLAVKFMLKNPGYITALRSELYPFGGTRGNLLMSVSTASNVGTVAFNTLGSMSSASAGFSSGPDSPSAVSKPGTFAAFHREAALMTIVPEAVMVETPQATATQKAIDLIGTLVKSKTFRENALYSK